MSEEIFDVQDQVEALIEQLRVVVLIEPDVPNGKEKLQSEWNRAGAAWQRVDMMVKTYLKSGKVIDLYDRNYRNTKRR